eukprot:GHVT01028503.1.p1 GENE.GHVT01028503.1~~GHVT01028503.1.p1  ORF type:complete len:438 (-),score=19.49 GHVT01028503.1:435-1748(-)
MKCIGITNQRETLVVWDRTTSQPLYDAIVWSDTRNAGIVEELRTFHGSPDALKETTGLPIATYFTATKLLWLMREKPDIAEALVAGHALCGTVDSWLIWKLTNGKTHVTDVTNASRTLLMNLKTLKWDQRLCQDIGSIPVASLPQIRSSAEHLGLVTHPSLCSEARGSVISGCLGDQHAACLGHGVFSKGQAKCTYGTGAFVLMHTGYLPEPIISNHGLLCTPCYQLGQDAPVAWALEGSIASAGNGVSWLKNNLGIISDAKETEEILATTLHTTGIVFVPAFSGLFCPWWRSDARGCILGLTDATRKEHIVRAMLESIGMQLLDVLEAMSADSGIKNISPIFVDGGMTKNAAFMQLCADIAGVTIRRPAYVEVTSLGAAIAAGLGFGIWSSLEEVKPLLHRDELQWDPTINQEERQNKRVKWNAAVEKSFGWTNFR